MTEKSVKFISSLFEILLFTSLGVSNHSKSIVLVFSENVASRN